jgi:hypothetical protein
MGITEKRGTVGRDVRVDSSLFVLKTSQKMSEQGCFHTNIAAFQRERGITVYFKPPEKVEKKTKRPSLEGALIAAVSKGSLETVEYLIGLGAFASDNAIHLACMIGDLRIIQRLIEAQKIQRPLGDNLRNARFQQFIDRAYVTSIERKDAYFVKYFLQQNVSDQLLLREIKRYSVCNDAERLLLLIDNGVSTLDDSLFVVCSDGRVELAEMLITLGAKDITAALWPAVLSGSLKLVKLLISHGAVPTTIEQECAENSGHVHMINTLHEAAIANSDKVNLKRYWVRFNRFLERISGERIVGKQESWRFIECRNDNPIAAVYHLHMWFLPSQRKTKRYQEAVRHLCRIQWVLQKKGVPSDVARLSILSYLF